MAASRHFEWLGALAISSSRSWFSPCWPLSVREVLAQKDIDAEASAEGQANAAMWGLSGAVIPGAVFWRLAKASVTLGEETIP